MVSAPATIGEKSETTMATTVEMDQTRRILNRDYNLSFSAHAIRNVLENR